MRRYRRERPGELLDLDIEKLARFESFGLRIAGTRRGMSRDMGYDCLRFAIHDPDDLKNFGIGRRHRWNFRMSAKTAVTSPRKPLPNMSIFGLCAE